MKILGIDLDGNGTAIVVGIVIGVLYAYFRRGSVSGDRVPFSGQ